MLEQIFKFVDSYAKYFGELSFWMLCLAVILLLVAHYFIVLAQKFLNSKGLEVVGAVISVVIFFEFLFTLYTCYTYIGWDGKLLWVAVYWFVVYLFGGSSITSQRSTQAAGSD